MALNILKIILLLLFFIMASQGGFYLFSVSKAFSTISLDAFAEQRNAITSVIELRLKIVIFLSIGLSFLIIGISLKNLNYPVVITTCFALICLLIDILLAIKFSIPINDIFKNYVAGSVDPKWDDLRITWLRFIEYRGVFQILGFVSLLAGSIWKKY